MRGNRAHRRIELVLATVLGLVALLALPGLAAAKAKDRNHDGIPDRWEKRHHLSLKVNEAHRNPDHEGLDNREEFENGTNPRRADTDRDGLTDSQEIEVGDDPNSDDTNHDGIDDGQENAGAVTSFDGTTLTIELFAGGTLSGQVTESTEIKCRHHDGAAQASDDQSGDDQSAEQADEPESDNEDQAGSCGTVDLVPGALVKEAELEATSAGGIFHSIDLAG